MLARFPKPAGYKPPSYENARRYNQVLRSIMREPMDSLAERKRALKGDISDALSVLPADKVGDINKIAMFGLPQYVDYIERVTGMIIQHRPEVTVTAPGVDATAQRRAAYEERCLNSFLTAIDSQQNRSPYDHSVAALIGLGGSWLSLWPDPEARDLMRRKGESAKEHTERAKSSLRDRVPFILSDVDPSIVYPYFTDRERLMIVQTMTSHSLMEVELGMGYRPLSSEEGKVNQWQKMTLGEPQPSSEGSVEYAGSAFESGEASVEKLVHVDPWTTTTFLDGLVVERWEHNMGFLPMFPARGGLRGDRDPSHLYVSIGDNARQVAKKLVLWEAIGALQEFQAAFPTGIATGGDGGSIQLKYGEVVMPDNIETIQFPFAGSTGSRGSSLTYQSLLSQMSMVTMPNFGSALEAGASGYAVSQLRGIQNSILGPVYMGLNRQWRDVFHAVRYQVDEYFGEGILLPGLVEEEEGKRFRRRLEYSSGKITDYDLEVEIERGIPQDEIAEHKAIMEKVGMGFMSRQQGMEEMGIKNPRQAEEEIIMDELKHNELWRNRIVEMAMEYSAEIQQNIQAQEHTPGSQAITQARGAYLGGPGNFANQSALPENANSAGPLNQQGTSPNPGGGQRGGAAQQTPSGPRYSEQNPP